MYVHRINGGAGLHAVEIDERKSELLDNQVQNENLK